MLVHCGKRIPYEGEMNDTDIHSCGPYCVRWQCLEARTERVVALEVLLMRWMQHPPDESYEQLHIDTDEALKK